MRLGDIYMILNNTFTILNDTEHILDNISDNIWYLKKSLWREKFKECIFLPQLVQLLAIPENIFTILTNTKQYLPVPINTIHTKQYSSIPNNTYQFWTIPNKPGITWYSQYIKNHYQYDSSIIIMWFWQFSVCLVLSQYWFWQFSQNLWCLV